jgi:phosphoglycerate dehydrogenase-like enzyme
VNIFMVGEAAEHIDDLRPHLSTPHNIIGLPWEAANSATFDDDITAEDVIVSLRFARSGSTAPAVRLLHVPGAGLDQINFSTLSSETLVANVFEHEIPIAEFIIARLLEWEIRAESLQGSFNAQAWPSLYRKRVPHGEIYGKTMVLIGYGRIGRAIAARASVFGVEVIAVDDHADSDTSARVMPTAELAELQQRADYLVVACPLTPATTGLIDAAALARMPAHAVLVNISRALIVDPAALYKALQDNEIGGAILDVWYRYPDIEGIDVAPAEVPLWELPNAWCTPHSSAWTTQLPRRRYAVIADNINRLVAGEPLRNLVHPAGGDSSRRSSQ